MTKKPSPYSKDVIIDFLYDEKEGPSPNAFILSQKYLQQMEIIPGHQFIDEKEKSKFLNQISADETNKRIYIIGHDGKKAITGNNLALDPSTLAHLLNNYIGHGENVIINLVVCESGKGTDNTNLDSYAARLQKEIFNISGKNRLVVARIASVNMPFEHHHVKKVTQSMLLPSNQIIKIYNNPQIRKAYPPSFFDIHHQPGSKFIFKQSDDNQPEAVDAYMEMWKRKVIKSIGVLHKNSKSEEERNALQKWQIEFVDLTSDEIEKKIRTELQRKDSVFKPDKSWFNFFFGPSEDLTTYDYLKNMLEYKAQLTPAEIKKPKK